MSSHRKEGLGKITLYQLLCCRKVDPFQDLRVGSCRTLKNALIEETHLLTRQETLLGMDTWVENSIVRSQLKNIVTT